MKPSNHLPRPGRPFNTSTPLGQLMWQRGCGVNTLSFARLASTSAPCPTTWPAVAQSGRGTSFDVSQRGRTLDLMDDRNEEPRPEGQGEWFVFRPSRSAG